MFQYIWNRLSLWHLVAIIAVVGFTVYIPYIDNGFIDFDDGPLILDNRIVQHINTWSLSRAFTTYDPELYIPFTLIAYQILHAIFGYAPQAFHGLSIMLHVLNGMLVFYLSLLLTRKRAVAFMAGILFVIHPINTEAVMWASGLKDILSAFFFLLSSVLYLRYREVDHKGLYTLSIIAFLCALFSKVSIIVLPVLLLLHDWYEHRPLRESVYEKIPYIVLSIVFGIIALIGKTGTLGGSSLDQNLLLSTKSILFYAWKIIVPYGLVILYPQKTHVTLASAEFGVSAVVILLALILIGWGVRKRVVPALLVSAALLCVVPSFTNFRKIGLLFFASDRYAYTATVFLFMLIGLLAWKVSRRLSSVFLRLLMSLSFCVWLGMLIVFAYRQAATWKSTETIFRHAIAHYPSAIAEGNLGNYLALNGHKEEANQHFERAIALDPRVLYPYVNLANYYRDKGDLDQAILEYKRGIDMIPYIDRPTRMEDMPLFYYLGEVYEMQGKDKEAVAQFEQATKVGPHIAEAFHNLGLQYEKRGRIAEAEEAYRKAVSLEKGYILSWYRLAGIYGNRGDLPLAIAAMEEVVRVNPGYEHASEHLKRMRNLLR
jgi:tetratricopeptide (TPR) repeat protein